MLTKYKEKLNMLKCQHKLIFFNRCYVYLFFYTSHHKPLKHRHLFCEVYLNIIINSRYLTLNYMATPLSVNCSHFCFQQKSSRQVFSNILSLLLFTHRQKIICGMLAFIQKCFNKSLDLRQYVTNSNLMKAGLYMVNCPVIG